MIRAEKLSKYYGGKRALGPVSFVIEDGETVGFLGLNGAGKTTALRILACDLRPSGGTVSVGDVDALANPHQVRQRIGFLPESPPLYQDMTVNDYLYFAGQLRGMSKSDVAQRLPRVLSLTHLRDVSHDVISHLSHGYRQRVGVAQAIIHNPTLIIMDEPTRGLDPVQIVEMRNMIHDLKSEHTVLISSHILTEISQTCDRLLILGRGRIIASLSVKDLEDIKNIKVEVRRAGGDADAAGADRDSGASANDDAIAKLISTLDGVDRVTVEAASDDGVRAYQVSCTRDVRAQVGRAVVEAGYDLLTLDSASELERVFLELVQGDRDAHD